MATYNDSIANSVWSDPANWSLGHVPIEGENVRILNGDTVTVDQNITVGDDSAAYAIDVQAGGTLLWPSSVAGSYSMTLKGTLSVSGVFKIGDSAASPIPSDRTATVIFNYSAALAVQKYWIQVLSTGQFLCYGAPRTYYHCVLNATANALATSLTTDVETGWLNGDVIAISATTMSATPYNEVESKILNGDAVGTTINLTSALSYRHYGVDPLQADVILLTRNVNIRAYNASYPSYFTGSTSAYVDLSWVGVKNMSGSTAAGYGWIHAGTTAGCRLAMAGCALYDWTGSTYGALYINNGTRNVYITDTVLYNFLGNPNAAIAIPGVLNYNTLRRIYVMRVTSSSGGSGFYYYSSTPQTYGASQDYGDLHASGTYQYGFNLQFCSSTQQYGGPVSLTGFYACSNRSTGGIFSFGTCREQITLDTVHIYLTMYSDGLQLQGYGPLFLIKNARIHGSGGANNNRSLGESVPYGLVEFENSTFGGCSLATTSRMFALSTSGVPGMGVVRFRNCRWDSIDWFRTGGFTHSFVYTNAFDIRIELDNCTTVLPSAVVSNLKQAPYEFCVQRDGGVVGKHWTKKPTGVISLDATIYKTTPPSERLAPSNAGISGYLIRLEGSPHYIGVNAGEQPTISVWVCKSALYTGNQPRLRVRINSSLGYDDDYTIDEMTVPNGDTSWELLTGAVPCAAEDSGAWEAFIDCHGNAGYVNDCDWSVS